MLDPTLKFARVLPGRRGALGIAVRLFPGGSRPLGSGYPVVAHRLPADFLATIQRLLKRRRPPTSSSSSSIRTYKSQMLLTLSLFTILLIFSATWFALYLSKQVTVPIQALARPPTKSPPAISKPA